MVDFKKVSLIAVLTSALGVGAAVGMDLDRNDADNPTAGITPPPPKAADTADLEERLQRARLEKELAQLEAEKQEQALRAAQAKAEAARLAQEQQQNPPPTATVPSAPQEEPQILGYTGERIAHNAGTEAERAVECVTNLLKHGKWRRRKH